MCICAQWTCLPMHWCAESRTQYQVSFFCHSPSYFLKQILSLSLKLSDRITYWPLTPRTHLFMPLTLSTEVIGLHLCTQPLQGYWRSELRPLCLSCGHFTHTAFFPSPQYLFLNALGTLVFKACHNLCGKGSFLLLLGFNLLCMRSFSDRHLVPGNSMSFLCVCSRVYGQ